MPVQPAPTPNPNAMKFSVGEALGGPSTYVKGAETDKQFVNDLLQIDGVASMFMTADFVTITKTSASSWESITPLAVSILEAHFGA
jgi:hypothetical protein